MDIATAYDITAPLDAPGRRAMAAQRELRTTADTLTHKKLADMLRICAEGLAVNPDSIGLCDRNHDRLWEAMHKADTYKDGPNAAEIHVAAMAFYCAAALLRGEA